MIRISILALLLIINSFIFAQSVDVKDSDKNTLIQITDEGKAGSITIPDASTLSTSTTNKLL